MNHRLVLIAAAALAPLPASAQGVPQISDRVCDVTAYGAKGSRVFADTQAFQRAVDDCAAKGGGTVRVPRGEYQIAPIFPRSHINLHLDPYSEVFGTSDIDAWRVSPATRKLVAADDWMALINITDATDVAITGSGRIDGQGAPWWERWRTRVRRELKGGGTDRPRLVQTMRSRNLLFEGVTLRDSPSFHLVVEQSDGVTVRGVTITAPAHSPNTDAIDPTDTRNMLIEGNTLDVGDDIVAIKANRVDPAHPDFSVENIVIRNNVGRAGRGICIGSGTLGGVRHVLVEHNRITGAMYGIRIKTLRGKGGPVRDVVFRDTILTDVATPFVFSDYYTSRGFDENAIDEKLKAGGFVLNDPDLSARERARAARRGEPDSRCAGRDDRRPRRDRSRTRRPHHRLAGRPDPQPGVPQQPDRRARGAAGASCRGLAPRPDHARRFRIAAGTRTGRHLAVAPQGSAPPVGAGRSRSGPPPRRRAAAYRRSRRLPARAGT